MANSDVIVRIKADAKNYDANLAKATRTLDKFKQDNMSMGGVISQSTTALTSMATKFLSVTAAVGAAMKVATDAFKQNELAMDEWGRSTEAAGAVYQGFLNALNTGDFGGFLRNIGNVITKAREAYDAMDQLGTFNAFNQIQIEGARTNFTEAMANYREGSGSKEDVKAAAEKLKTEMQSRQDKEQAAYIAAIKELAASRGVDAEMLKKALSGTYGDYETLKNTQMTGVKVNYHSGGQFGGVYTTETKFAATEEEKLGEMLRKLNDDELAHIQSLGAQAQRTATEIAQVDKQTVRVLGANKGNNMAVQVPVEVILPEGSAAALRKQISDLQKQWETATTQDERNSIKGQIDAANEALKAMTPQIEPVAAAIKDAAAMWTEHSEKIADVKARLAEFQAMMGDTSLSDDQRDWAAGMADAYQEQLDKMKGVTEEAVDDIKSKMEELPSIFDQNREALDRMSAGVGAISTLGNAFNDLKGIGEDLASAFSGEMDAWDALMTVFNSGIGIMQTVIGVMEAINTLQSLSSNLSKKKKADQAAETAAVVGGKTSETTAEMTEAGASMTAAGANAAQGATGAGKAVSWIPIVGPILAAAAIAATIGAMIAAMNKGKSASHFATGGIVPGNDYSDNTPVFVSSGELILNRAQQDSVASQLQNNNPMDNLHLSMEVNADKFLIGINNSNRMRGGTRGYYTKVH